MPHLYPETLEAFHDWIDVRTWHTGHEADEQRFDKFIETLLSSDGTLSPEELRDLIISTEREGVLPEASLDRRAEEQMARYRKLEG